MNTKKIGISSLLVLACASGFSLAATIPFIETSSVSASPSTSIQAGSSTKVEEMAAREDAKMIAAPYYGNDKTYVFDQTGTKAFSAKQSSSLVKVNCNATQVLKDLGLGDSSKVTSLSIGETIFDYSFDFRSCSLRGNKKNNTRSNKAVLESQAITVAKEFMKNAYFAKKLYSQYGAPIVIAKNGNNIRPYLLKGAEVSPANADDVFSGVDVDANDTGDVNVSPEYTSFSILFPYALNGTPIYNSYGQRAGITLEVTADGVTSINAQLLPFKISPRNAEKLTGDDLIGFIQRGGNNAFRGNQKEISLQKPQKVMVLFSLWRNNVNELYLSSGIRLGSAVKQDQYSQQNYEMIISDYKIGNSSLGW